jgi:inorganic pyrophosphatase
MSAAICTARTYADLPQIALEQIQHFFAHYKDLEPGKWVR